MAKSKHEKFAELSDFPNVIQLGFKEISKKDFHLKGQWGKTFFKNNYPITLELGCGKGEYTLALAAKHPEKNFIGIDIKGARLWKGVKLAQEKNLTNVCFLRTQLEFMDKLFSVNEINEIWLPFPDPQMKKKRKRLVGIRFLSAYQQILTENGRVHVKTDSNFLFTYLKELLKANDIQPLLQLDDISQKKLQNDLLGIETHYEKQFSEMKIPIKYILFSLPKKKLADIDIPIKYDSWKSYGRGKRPS